MHGPDASAKELFARGLRETIVALVASGARVWVVEEVPDLPFDPPYLAARMKSRGKDVDQLGLAKSQRDQRQAFFRDTIAAIRADARFEVLTPDFHLCDESLCRAILSGRSLYRDSNHLSDFGADYVKPLLHPVFREISGKSMKE